MSEASESLHLWRTTHDHARRLALSVGILGRIVAANENWTCFVAFVEDEAAALASAVPGLVLHWVYFEDFGLGLTFFEAGKELGEIRFVWGATPGEPGPPPTDRNLIERLRNDDVLHGIETLEQLARGVAGGSYSPRDLRDRTATLLNLPAYAWLSPHYCRDTPVEEIRRQFPEAEDVGG